MFNRVKPSPEFIASVREKADKQTSKRNELREKGDENQKAFQSLIDSMEMKKFAPSSYFAGEKLTIFVSQNWHAQPYRLRLQAAQQLHEMWAKIHSPDSLDYTEIELRDIGNNIVGGSSPGQPTKIWVVDK